MSFSLLEVQTGLTDTVYGLLENMVLTLLVVGATEAVVTAGLTVTGTVAFTGCTPELADGRLATIIAVLGVTS